MPPRPPKSGTELFHRTIDGRDIVCRRGYCECGTLLYEYNLTDNQFELRVRERWEGRNNPVQRYQLIEPGGNPTVTTISCPDCGRRHIVANIKEGTSIADTVATSTDAITIEGRGS